MENIIVRGKQYTVTRPAFVTKVPDRLFLDIRYLGVYQVNSLFEAQEKFCSVRDESGFGPLGYEYGLIYKDGEEYPFACVSYYGIISRIVNTVF